MGTIASRAPAPRAAGRNAYLVFVALAWVGIISGFGTDSFRHVSQHGLDYPLIVHVHAVTFVAWLALVTVQIWLIRERNGALHRRLGVIGALIAVWMLIIGPATAIAVDAARYAATGKTPEFLSIQLADMVGFAGLIGTALALRRNRAIHQRLMMLSMLAITDAGFARFMNDPVAALLPDGMLGNFVWLYFFTDVLVVAFIGYDWRTRGRPHPACLAALAWILAIQLSAIALFVTPAWKTVALRLIGA